MTSCILPGTFLLLLALSARSAITQTSGVMASSPAPSRQQPKSLHLFSQLGLAAQIGISGPGIDFATPLAQRFDLRVGGNFLPISTSFQEQGVNVGARLHLQSAHAAVDWSPSKGDFHISPLLVFANNNRLRVTADVPPGNTIRINGNLYSSSYTDPLRAVGRIDFHKVSPGLSLGFGSILPHKRSRFSIPVEFGFYYAGKPSLQVNFTGSACDPDTDVLTCEIAAQDSSLQRSVAAAIARRTHYLNDARFFPIFSVGIAYRLW